MQFTSTGKRIFAFLIFCFIGLAGFTQVNAVTYGKNRIQHKKFTWKFYQSPNFNSYFTQGGLELSKFVAQVAEEELTGIESLVEYALQRRVNIIIYNDYNDMRSSNIGLGNDWASAGGQTQLVNNKMIVYFNGNHANLKQQVREGIARVLMANQLFGEDIGEFASNQALLDLPQWLTNGYVAWVAQPWSTEKDDDLKSAMLSGTYNNFYQFAFDKPVLAGHAFWYYISEKYKKENVTYFLYLARIYKNLNSASQRIAKKKFKDVLADFMQFQQDRYFKDIRQRRNVPKGSVSVTEEVSKNMDYYRFNANPNPRSNAYVVVEYKKGLYSVKLNENYETIKTLLKSGVKTRQFDINPNYPLMAWDGKGTRIAVIHWEDGKIKMFVYDPIARYTRDKHVIEGLDQILDVQYMLDANTLLLSAVKNGHSDIYTYKIDTKKLEQLTNDVYDDLNPSFVSFPNKTGIIFSSNRPGPNAISADTVLPSDHRFNIFLLDYLTKKQISQLTNLKYGNGTTPMQYNVNHFTFVSDENGVGNRWAGFFSTKAEGLDTLYYVGDEILRNPGDRELDSALVAWQRNEPDSISYFSVTKDSTYSFPITNYQSSLLETRIAGDRGQVSEVVRQGDYKFLYKLRVDSLALRRRNTNARPTEYRRNLIAAQKAQEGKATIYQQNKLDSSKKDNGFISEFDDEKRDRAAGSINESAEVAESVLQQSKLYNYRLKFSADNFVAGVSNNLLINRYQQYMGGTGPIRLGNGSNVNFTFSSTISDLLEDYKFTGGFRMGSNLKGNEYLFNFQNLRKKIDWGATFYRTSNPNLSADISGGNFNTELNTTFYQFNATYPFNEVKSLRTTIAYRRDRAIIKPFNNNPQTQQPEAFGLEFPDQLTQYAIGRIEYVHDNTINPTQNIWDGLRWKTYFDFNMPIRDKVNTNMYTFNYGVDARYYIPIYRNFIWAGRAAGDLSWGNKKLIYYLGGVDGWFNPQFNDLNRPAQDQDYAFQTLAVNMRGFIQNVANGNNAVVLNSEFRLPVFSTLFNKPINNAFLRNFQLTQFFDLGTAWNGQYNKIQRPTNVYSEPGNPVTVRERAGGIGPLAGGYGFGARSTLLGHFVKADAGWQMNGVFRGKPTIYISLGLDF